VSVFDYIFDNEWSQRSDIEKLKEENASLASRVRRMRSTEVEKGESVEELRRQVGELALLSKTLVEILLDKEVCTGRDIEQVMRRIDLEDGVEDGQLTKPVERPSRACPECKHLLAAEQVRCLYCGYTR